MGEDLTGVQRDVLEMLVVGKRLARAGFGKVPTYHDICAWSGLKSPGSPWRALKGLETKGYIRFSEGRSLSVEILKVIDGGMVP